MPPRTLASLAHALAVAPHVDAALVALADALAELDRFAHIALVRYDSKRGLLRDVMVPAGDGVETTTIDTALDHLPTKERAGIAAGGEFVDFGDHSDEFARLFHMPELQEAGWLVVRGFRFEGQLTAALVLYETRKIFGTRTSDRFAPSVALFDLAYMRFLEGDARLEAVRTLEDVTQRVHGEYDRKLEELEQKALRASGESAAATDRGRMLSLEREVAQAAEEARRAKSRAEAVESTVGAAVEQLEKAHIELHRRSESLRQKTRTIYLIDRVLTLDASTDDPRQLVDGLLSLVGDDMHAQRCSLMLRTPDNASLYLAAARGVAPNVSEGYRVAIGEGVAGRVAQSREPLLVRDVTEARTHPLLRDQHFTTGSFISFPIVYQDELVGVVNLTNRALHGVFVDEDVERVRLLGLLIALIATQARLADRLLETISVR